MVKEKTNDAWPTIFELATSIPYVDLTKPIRAGAGRNAPPATLGFEPEPFPLVEGYWEATPSQLASLKVPKLEIGPEGITGFQREKANAHVRSIGRALISGKEMPPLMISIFPDGEAYVDDGQHRALGSVLSGVPLEVVVKKRTIEEARELYANQGRQRKVSGNDTLLTGESAIELYVQDACTNSEHPWASIVSPNGRKGRITPVTMVSVVGPYAYNSLSSGVNFYVTRPDEDFDVMRANQLARLIGVFGTKETNPMAFTTQALRAIGSTAVYVLRRNPHAKREDVQRWLDHMGSFDFSKFPHLRNKQIQMSFMLVEHWNKYLRDDRRVDPLQIRMR